MLKKLFIFIILCLGSHSAAQPVPQRTENYELQSIEFKGNKYISSSTLMSIILSEESPGWFWQFLNTYTPFGDEPEYFDSSKIPFDLSSLSAYYNANGFFKAKFSYEYQVDTTSKDVYLTYTIEENEPSNFGNLRLLGLEKVDPLVVKNIYKATGLDTNARYSESFFQQKIEESVNILLNTGYMFAEFDSSVVYKDTSGNNAHIYAYFSPKNRYTIDTVYVRKDGEGAEYVDEDLIREISGIKTGYFYNLDELRRSQVRLFRTGLFNTVSISGVETDTSGTRVPILLEGYIGLMNELSPEIIMNNQQSAFNIGLGATYIRKNFLGQARKLTLSSSFGVQDIVNVDFGNLIKKFSFRDTTLLGYVDARATIDQPFVFSRPIQGKLEIYATINKQKIYNNTVYGSKITFEFEMPRHTFVNFLSTSYNLEQSNEVYRTFDDSLSKKLLSSIGVDFGSTTIDNLLFPTKGYNLSFQLEEGNSFPYLFTKLFNEDYKGALFYKTVITGSVFGSFGRIRNYIFAGKLKIGHLQAYVGDYGGLPLNRTFYAGGSNSIRGWRANELVPEGTPDVPGFITSTGANVKGGTFLLEGSFEFRLRFMQNFGVALFTDYGNTWLGYNDFRFDRVAVAAGMGARYYSSIAPFRIDFGFKFYDPKDKGFIFTKNFWKNLEFHFGIGEAF
jgi:outer membrane protein insertion porin family